MTIKETNEFMERIKSHYQEFIIDDFKIKEWHKELSKYDAEDVNKKFEEHLKSELYGDSIPKVYFLTKYLVPTEDKGKVIHHNVVCQLCNQTIFDDDYDNHYKRCSSATTIARDMKNYFNVNTNYQIMMHMDEKSFDELYVKYLNKMLGANITDLRKKIILRCLYPDLDTETLAEMIKTEIKKQN